MNADVVLSGLPFPHEVFLEKARKHPGRVFLTQPQSGGAFKEFTWAQAADEALRMASALQKLNLPPRSHIAILSKNCAYWVLADLAIWLSGHVSIPLYPNLNAETARTILEHSETKAIFLGKLDRAEKMVAGVPDGTIRIGFPETKYPGALDWDTLVKENQPTPTAAKLDMKDIATIVYTSGTTGKPKGVMHSYEGISFAGVNGIKHMGFNDSDRFFSYLPLAHVAERCLVEIFGLFCGGSIFFAENLENFAKNVQQSEPTVFLAVPRIWLKFQQGVLAKFPQAKIDRLLSIPIVSRIIKSKVKKTLGLSKVTTPVTGAAPTSPELMEWFSKFGINIQEAYGMTENIAYSHAQLRNKIKFGSVGQPMLGVDTKISKTGEILVKSPASMLGYYKDPALTKEAMEDGYLKTGDMGTIDAQGYLSLTGRMKDLFKTAKGKYVAPTPIELQLSNSDYLEQVCVVGTGLSQPVALATLSPSGSGKSKDALKSELDVFLKGINAKLDPHERLSKLVLLSGQWSVENEMLTPTLKVKRAKIEQTYNNLLPGWESQTDRVVMEA